MKVHPKLALGTVQLGLQYGIRQRIYKPPTREESAEILGCAALHQVSFLDTAFEYGESEDIIGSLRSPGWSPKFITKTPKLREGALFPKTGKLLQKAYEISCADLRVPSCYALLVHSPENLMQPGGNYLTDALLSLKQAGKVSKVGVSVYDREEIEQVMEHFPIDMVQLPMNLADQRLLEDGTLIELQSRGVEIHVRSAFLQGALLMELEEVPNGMEGLLPAISELNRRAVASGTTPLHILLRFLLDLKEIDAVVVGVNLAMQLEELCKVSIQPLPEGLDLSPLPVEDKSLFNPGTWQKRINI